MSFGFADAERAALLNTFEDTADILRASPVTAESAISAMVFNTVYSGIICAMSYSIDWLHSEKSRQTQAQQNIDYNAVIFMPPELSILPGDRVLLRRFGRDNPHSNTVLHFEVLGRTAVYTTHQQIRVRDSDIS